MRELIVTSKGKELMAKLIAGKTTATFTKIKTTDRDLNGDLESIIDFDSVKQEALVSSIERVDYTVVEVLAMINNMDLDQGYYIKAVGLYATENNGEEILYAISIAGDHADYMPPYGGKTVSTVTYKLITRVDNTEQITININSAALPTITQVNEIKQISLTSKELLDVHLNMSVSGNEGAHNLKYDTSTKTLQYKDNDNWETIPTGQEAEKLINEHKGQSILSENGVHGLRYNSRSREFEYLNNIKWDPIKPDNSELEIIKYMLSEKIIDNVFSLDKDDVSIEGGCYDYLNKKYFINIS